MIGFHNKAARHRHSGAVLTLLRCEIAQKGSFLFFRFEDIEVNAWHTPRSVLRGYDAEHIVQNVTVEHLRINGRQITDMASGGFTQNAFVRDVDFRSSDSLGKTGD